MVTADTESRRARSPVLATASALFSMPIILPSLYLVHLIVGPSFRLNSNQSSRKIRLSRQFGSNLAKMLEQAPGTLNSCMPKYSTIPVPPTS